MPKRPSPHAARMIDDAGDIDAVVVDKRAGWRASPATARRRPRRCARLLTYRPSVDSGGFGVEAGAGDEPRGVEAVRPQKPRDDG